MVTHEMLGPLLVINVRLLFQRLMVVETNKCCEAYLGLLPTERNDSPIVQEYQADPAPGNPSIFVFCSSLPGLNP